MTFPVFTIQDVRATVHLDAAASRRDECSGALFTETTITRNCQAMRPFPIRYGWLKKAFDAVRDTEEQEDNRQVFTGPDAIARFGVGKNMVASMRHWATVTGMIADDPDHRHISTTHLGDLIFGEGGLDPYMEHPITAWLLHWHLCGRETKTTWFWAFHYYPSISFERRRWSKGFTSSPKSGSGLVHLSRQ